MLSKPRGGGRQHPSRRTGDGAPRYLTKVLTPHGQASKTPEQTQTAPPRPVAWLCQVPSVVPPGLNETLGRGAPDGCRRPGHHQPLGVSLTLSLWRSCTHPGEELPVATRARGRLWGDGPTFSLACFLLCAPGFYLSSQATARPPSAL